MSNTRPLPSGTCPTCGRVIYDHKNYFYGLSRHNKVGPLVTEGWKVIGELSDVENNDKTLVVMEKPK